ncbi:MAG: 5-dehydro-2-deoxygluconokinase [Faecalibacterium prausnitzii]|uniref:5-dehydro-2-deoxygluconokinase n=1 Tax=Faecalibacterium prausnitzii TaxID=853 RepID=A0A943FXC4_9FIRM|nr:5-dehydro-2-deoxygluconokinase [Faecalibacterium prausnitzii]
MLKFDLQKPNDVVAFGRATIDLYANEIGPMEAAKTFSKYVGGSPANTAVAMARLGLKVGYIGKVSDDQFGRFIVRYLADQGVDTSHIETAASGIRSGVTMGEIKEGSCNCFMYRTDCADLHTSLSHSPAREAVFLAIAMAKRNGVVVAFDLDYRDGTWDNDDETSIYFTLAAQQADMVLGTREEFDKMEELFHPGNHDDDRSAHWLLEKGVSLVSIKQGKKGSHLYTAEGRTMGGIYPTKVLKSFGAGDSYSGSFNNALIRGKSLEEALKYAAAAASITITGHSCSDAMPTLDQVEEYMQTHEYQMPEA